MAATSSWDRLPAFLALGLIGFPIGGVFFGRWLWGFNEKKYESA